MTASFQKTQFAPVVYVPPENLPVRRDAGSLVRAGRQATLRPSVIRLRPVAGGASAALGPAEVYTVRREAVSVANAYSGGLIDVYA